jgi:prefoldin subunit 5
MKERGPVAVLVVVAACLLVVSGFPAPAARATIYSCAGTGCGFWWYDAVWNGRYVGNTLEFDLWVVNTNNPPLSVTIATVKLVTPWGTFTDNTLPQTVPEGQEYSWYADFTIPSTAAPGGYSLNYTFTGTYPSGTALCYDKTPPNICSSTVSISVSANPDTLQAQVTSLQAQVTSLQQTITSLNANITSLKSQVSNLQAQQASLQAQLSIAKGNITALQAALATTNSQLSTTKASLSSAQGQLASTQATLASTQATLASTQSSLSTASNLYLPLGVAIPSIVAALLAVLYFRKKPGPPPP